MTVDHIVSLLGLVLLAASSVGCAEQSVETSAPDGLERHIFAILSNGGGEGVKLMRTAAQRRTGRGASRRSLRREGLRRAGGRGMSDEQLRRQFICMMRAAAEFRTGFIKQHPERAEEPLRLAFYFNGGLNDRDAVVSTAADSWEDAKADGIYPIYMIWPTGGYEAWTEDTLHVRNGRHLKKKIMSPGASMSSATS